ncbi:MAG TPA: GNAT family N-acetyltransferase [Candidatus Limnocylindrales bacterium]
MTVEIRRAREDDLPAYIDALSAGFLERPDVGRIVEDVKPLWDLDRTWGAFADGRVVGTFRSWATEITVPGGVQLPAAAVAAVTVLPTHRRRGILRGMAAAEHAAARERGEVFGLLYASEYPIYGRFGYGDSSPIATWTLDTLVTGFHGAPSGSVTLETANEPTRDAMKRVFEAWRRRQPGEIRRRDFSWDLAVGLREEPWDTRWKGFIAFHRDGAGEVDGYARYHGEGKWEHRQPRTTLVLDELHALTDAAFATLWRYLAEIDWVSAIRAERRSPSDRLRWLLTNARAAEPSDVGDGLWVRIIDLVRALENRAYEREGGVVLEVVDPEAPGGRVRVELEAGPSGAKAKPTRRSPDLTVDVAALGAAYLGGRSLRAATLAAGADEHRAGALAEAERLFRTVDEPWCSTFF